MIEVGTESTHAVRTYDAEALTHYLALRHLASDALEWVPGCRPTLPTAGSASRVVSTAAEIREALHDLIPQKPRLGILLSGGIDSAILAALAPPATPCLTLCFDAQDAFDESVGAAAYAERWGHPHHVIQVSWRDHEQHTDALMMAKSAPLHPVEVPLHLAARQARELGIETLLVGNGADSTFGGMDKLLGADWTFDAFVKRYCFVDPAQVLRQPASIAHVFEPYRTGNTIDVQGFLHQVHGQGIVQSFDNAIASAGVSVLAPYEALVHDGPLDLERIRAGEPKYLLQTLFRELYGATEVPEKVPFARPMDQWMTPWRGPKTRAEYRPDLASNLWEMTGEQRYLIWCLDRFLQVLDRRRS